MMRWFGPILISFSVHSFVLFGLFHDLKLGDQEAERLERGPILVSLDSGQKKQPLNLKRSVAQSSTRDEREKNLDEPIQEVPAQEVWLTTGTVLAEGNQLPHYPSEAEAAGWEGDVVLKLSIGEQGKVDVVEIEQTSGYSLLDESASEAAKQWHFTKVNRGICRVPIGFKLVD